MRTLLGTVLFVFGSVVAHPALAASENAKRDANRVPVSMGVTGDAAQERRMFRMDPNTGQLLVSFSRTWPGADSEVYVVNTVTVTGAVDVTLTHTATVTGAVEATIPHTVEVRAALTSSIPGVRTNAILESDALDNAGYWGLAGVTIQADATAGPDGQPTADLVKEDNSTGYHNADQVLTLLADTPKAISFYAKQKERYLVWVQIYDIASPFSTALQFYDVNAGSLGSTDQSYPGFGIRSAEIVPSTMSGEPGWWRCKLVVEKLPGITSYGLSVGVAATDGVVSYTGTTGYGAYITRVQVEDDETTVGPPIKTATSAVTEGSDVFGDVNVSRVALDGGGTSGQKVLLGKRTKSVPDEFEWAPSLQVVRRDTPIGAVADGNYFLIEADAHGRLWVNLGAVYFSLTMHGDVRAELRGDITGAGDLVRWTATTDGQGHVGPHVFPSGLLRSASTYAVSVSNAGAVNLFPEALPGATSLMIQNLGTKAVFLGDVNVTAATGIQLGNGGVFTLDFTNEALVWYAIGTIATAQNLRIGRW